MQRSCWFKVQSLRFKEKQAADYKNFTQIAQSSQIRQQNCRFKVQKRCRAFKVQGCPQRAAELLVQGSKFKEKQAAD